MADFDLNAPEFQARCREVYAELKAGVPLTLMDIADRLGVEFNSFVEGLAEEVLHQGQDELGLILIVGETVLCEGATLH